MLRTATRARSRDVTIDKSLRGKGRLARARNVLKREERMAQLQADDRWPAGRSPLGLPKVRVVLSSMGKKKKKKAKEEADTTAAAADATPPAAGTKAAAPAAKTAGAAKPAAPAKPSSGKK
jgi:small basic protein (TIGR04137 family)